mgnify:FL=1
MPQTLKINGKIFTQKVSGATISDANYHAELYRRDYYVRIIKRKLKKYEREGYGYDTLYVVYISKKKTKGSK